ncbi:MAG: type I restriction enzyme HsdR N-terminal domain-containing protein [Deltaproteobacteria bacterium]|nr:type I restriction enzyme HsdR N-terminal domain-containing protein [Deltaproteobacteria bacterium]
MGFADRVKQLIASFEKVKESVTTEEAVKHSLVMPLLQALGYNIFDPTEVVPEFTADVGKKKGEKVDYALMIDGKPLILMEVKPLGVDLEQHKNQLIRYFTVTDAKFGIITDGIQYQFFSDLEDKNKMDEKPFLIVDLTTSVRDSEIGELRKFHRSYFDAGSIASAARNLKYMGELKRYFRQQLAEPNEEFARFFIKKFYSGSVTKQVLEKFGPIVQKGFNQYVNEIVSDRLKSALEEAAHAEAAEAASVEEEPTSSIITTEEEIEGYQIIRAILRPYIDPARIQYKDTKSYFVVNYEGSTWKWICRLHLTPSRKAVTFPKPDGSQETIKIDSLDDLFSMSDRFKAALDLAIEGSKGSN